ncbi:MAG: uroporphyrinogen-III C-methyltransferase [Candidatus Bathyarchaeota archaeon]|nr:uroporphyrinogen-III C-methyltransferase [Candidatus Bathyarchaeota archaeon]
MNVGGLELKKGTVYLVGSGPGDPDLISVKGLRLLENADVVIYDRLVSRSIIEMIPKKIDKIFAGKYPGKPHLNQDEINELMIREAKKGKKVVRLKSGDVFLFGRGGEEAQILMEAGIDYEIVPGISSAFAAPAYVGIPLTHRDYASSVAIVTGHEDPTKSKNRVDWKKLAKSVDTLVIMMGVRKLETIIGSLMKGGKSPETSIAIIESGTTKDQRVTIGVLGNIIDKARNRKVKAPAVIVIGDIVKLHEEISWLKR